MSRSEHATRRDPRDPGDLARKRRIKELATDVHLPDALPEASVEAIEIEIRDRGPFVHYPASIDDLRAVMARLPGVADGLGSITLCLDERVPDDDRAVDPYLGRVTHELIPGVFSSRVLGQYNFDRSRVFLFGYVYDLEHPLRRIIEPYLRLEMLSTFVHELAHHQDRVMREGSDRWRNDDVTDSEIYAEALQHTWTHDVVVPYLEETYPDELAELRGWLVRHGGVALPLEVLAGDPRTTAGTEGEKLFFSIDGAFEGLVARVMKGGTPPTTSVEFANDLHYGTHYDEAHAILDSVLAAHPDLPAALVLRADIFVHQARLAEADAIVRGLLERDDRDTRAWEVAADIAQHSSDWTSTCLAGQRLAELFTKPEWGWIWGLDHAIRGAIELADRDYVARSLAAMREHATTPYMLRRVEALECLALVREQRYREAFELATRIAGEGYKALELDAIRFEAAYHLHLPYDLPRLPRAILHLRQVGYGAWADRLEALA